LLTQARSHTESPSCHHSRHRIEQAKLPDPELRYLILGHMEVHREGRPCTPTAPKPRALLTLLLLNANRTSSVGTLIDELWGGHPPRSAAAALQMYVSGLRRVLDPRHSLDGRDARQHPVLRTTGFGYLLRVEPDALDLERSRKQAALGRRSLAAGECAAAGEQFRSALALWRGRALEDVGHHHIPAYYRARLEEERLALTHDRIGTDICGRRAREVIAELEELCARHPLHESFHEQLMTALADAGRRAEALDAYARARRAMIAETGIEPGPNLQSVQRALLNGLRPVLAGHERCRRREHNSSSTVGGTFR
jgi:DNA-binding SARP family transcriptional activator